MTREDKTSANSDISWLSVPTSWEALIIPVTVGFMVFIDHDIFLQLKTFSLKHSRTDPEMLYWAWWLPENEASQLLVSGILLTACNTNILLAQSTVYPLVLVG